MSLSTPTLLVATPSMDDPNFAGRVVLLVEHGEEGSLGFVINHLGDFVLGEVLNHSVSDVVANVPMWVAGPVPSDTGMLLFHKEPGVMIDQSSCGDALLPDAFITASQNVLETLLAQPTPSQYIHPYRVLLGYVGWGPTQLDSEIKLGAWLPLAIDKEILFDTPSEILWGAALQKLGIANQVSFSPQNDQLQWEN